MECFKYIVLCIIMLLKLHQCDTQECNYMALAKAVINDQTNLYELSRAFFPPEANSPEFVAVSYFLNGIENQSWYWSTFTSSFIHPPEVIQFMSLFFAKPHNYYKGQVRIDIPKEVAGCVNDLPMMQLLTQRLQLYASQQTHQAKIDESYSAKAYIANPDHNPKLLKFTFEEASVHNIKALIIVSQLFIVLLSIAVICTVVSLFAQSKQNHWAKKMSSKKPLILSITVVSISVTAYNFTLSCCSVKYWTKYTNDPLYKYDQPRNTAPVVMLILSDLFSLFIVCPVMMIISCIFKLCNQVSTTAEYKKYDAHSGNSSGKSLSWYVILPFTIVAPIISYIAHSPYIVIAYLNDGHHAGSIFIYYTIVICMEYVLCWIAFHPHSFLHPKNEADKCKCSCSCCTTCCLGFWSFVAFICLTVIITVYFVIIPINKSISDAPDQLAGIYRSGGFLIVSFIVYKMISFFYYKSKPSSLEKAVLKRTEPLRQSDNNWNQKSDDDKLEEFYEVVVSIISQKHPENKSIRQKCTPKVVGTTQNIVTR